MITNAPPLGLTGWTECHRQLLGASSLVLTVLAAVGRERREGRRVTSREGRGAGLDAGTSRGLLAVGEKKKRQHVGG